MIAKRTLLSFKRTMFLVLMMSWSFGFGWIWRGERIYSEYGKQWTHVVEDVSGKIKPFNPNTQKGKSK